MGGRTEQAKTRQGFRHFRGELINVEVDYDNLVERNNKSDSISGVLSEEENELNMIPKRL